MPLAALPILYLSILNLVAFALMGWDKSKAQARGWRILERTLLTAALLGGSIGAIAAQQLYRHKTRKEPFRTLLWLIPVLQAIVVMVLIVSPGLRAALHSVLRQ